MDGVFSGWQVDCENGVIIDDCNCAYRIGELRAIYYWREMWGDHVGRSQYQINSLKEELDKKIAAVRLPEIVVDWGEVQERFIHPHYRR